MDAGIFMLALFLMANDLAQQKNAQHSVQPTSGSRRVFQALLASESFFRQSGGIHAPPTCG
jgi:hypothetical protein